MSYPLYYDRIRTLLNMLLLILIKKYPEEESSGYSKLKKSYMFYSLFK
jgi:hypothetical protein